MKLNTYFILALAAMSLNLYPMTSLRTGALRLSKPAYAGLLPNTAYAESLQTMQKLPDYRKQLALIATEAFLKDYPTWITKKNYPDFSEADKTLGNFLQTRFYQTTLAGEAALRWAAQNAMRNELTQMENAQREISRQQVLQPKNKGLYQRIQGKSGVTEFEPIEESPAFKSQAFGD